MALKRKAYGSPMTDLQAQAWLVSIGAVPTAPSPFARPGDVTYRSSSNVTLIASRLPSGFLQFDSVCSC